MSKNHEYLTAGICVLLIVVLAFSNALNMGSDVVSSFLVLIGGASGWLFRGRINGIQK